MSFHHFRMVFGLLLVAVLSLATPSALSAQSSTATTVQPHTRLSPDFKGSIGLGLIGAELGFVIPALAEMHQTWAYIVFPLIGAAGGGVAGYFLLEQGNHPELAVATLSLGMALVIPAMILTITESSYDPEESEDQARNSQRALARARVRRLQEAGSGMVRVTDDGLALSAPGLTVVPGMRGHELRMSGLSVSLLSGRF